MAKPRGCQFCFVEMERIVLASGRAMLFCAACDMIGDERDLAAGAPPERAGMTRKPLKLVVKNTRPLAMKKISLPGRKSLTA